MFHVLCANTWQPSGSKTWKMKKKRRKCRCFIFKVKVEPTVSIYSLNQTFLRLFSSSENIWNVSRQVHHLDLFYDHSNIITAKSQTGFCQLVEEYIFFPRNTRLPDCCRQVSMSVDDITTSCLGVLLTTPENAFCNFKTNSEKSILRNIYEPMDAAIVWLIHIYLTHKIQSSKTHVT